jgi:hypothetical protein
MFVYEIVIHITNVIFVITCIIRNDSLYTVIVVLDSDFSCMADSSKYGTGHEQSFRRRGTAAPFGRSLANIVSKTR